MIVNNNKGQLSDKHVSQRPLISAVSKHLSDSNIGSLLKTERQLENMQLKDDKNDIALSLLI